MEDVFSLFSSADIRRTRDSSLQNLQTLFVEVSSRLICLRNHPSFPDPDLAPEREALNCIRVLTRILPYIYEADHSEEWESKLLWGERRQKTRRTEAATEVLFDGSQPDPAGDTLPQQEDTGEQSHPLAEDLHDTLTDLLFFTGFTLPPTAGSRTKVTYAIWQSGVGCKTSVGSNKDLERNRCEVLRLLLTFASKSIYLPAALLPVQGVRSITYLVTCVDKQLVLSILCSLLNTVMKYHEASWKMPYDHVVWTDSKQTLVVYSIQFLLVLLLYPVPEDGRGVAPKNYYRSWLGKLHRPEDFQFIAEGMTRILSQPMQATSSYLPGSQKSVRWAPEMIMLFWETLQCNKRFRAFVIESKRAQDFVILVLFYAIESKKDPSRQGVVKMCVFILQTLSVEPGFGESLNKRFDAQDTLPQVIRIANFRGSYADFLIISIHNLITGSMGKLDALYPALLATINNISPYTTHLSTAASSKILQLFTSMSSPSFLLANETNHTLLQSLLESINQMIELHYVENPNLIYAVLKARKQVEALRAFTLETGQAEIDQLARRAKESSSVEDGGVNARSGISQGQRPSLGEVPEDGAFVVGESEDDESDHEETRHTPTAFPAVRSSNSPSRSPTGDNVPAQLRGMSEIARGKMPINSPSFSRQNSTASLAGQSPQSTLNGAPAGRAGSNSTFAPTTQWIESWLPELPLHTMLTVIKALSPRLAASARANNSSSSPSQNRAANARHFLSTLPETASDPIIATLLSPAPSTASFSPSSSTTTNTSVRPLKHKVHSFTWSPMSLGWYESLLWSMIFTSEMLVGSTSSSSTASSALSATASSFLPGAAAIGRSHNRSSSANGGQHHAGNGGGSGGSSSTAAGGTVGAVGVWNGTNVRLFGVKEGVKEGPTLMRPKGAVDAVGNKIVKGLGGLGLADIGGRVWGGGNSRNGRGSGSSGSNHSGRHGTPASAGPTSTPRISMATRTPSSTTSVDTVVPVGSGGGGTGNVGAGAGADSPNTARTIREV